MFAESLRDLTTGRGITIPFLALRVRREYLIYDTLAQLSGKTRELKKQLKVGANICKSLFYVESALGYICWRRRGGRWRCPEGVLPVDCSSDI